MEIEEYTDEKIQIAMSAWVLLVPRHMSPGYPPCLNIRCSGGRTSQHSIYGAQNIRGVEQRWKINRNFPILSYPYQGAVRGPNIGPVDPRPAACTMTYVKKFRIATKIHIAEPVVCEYRHFATLLPGCQSSLSVTILQKKFQSDGSSIVLFFFIHLVVNCLIDTTSLSQATERRARLLQFYKEQLFLGLTISTLPLKESITFLDSIAVPQERQHRCPALPTTLVYKKQQFNKVKTVFLGEDKCILEKQYSVVRGRKMKYSNDDLTIE
jgi:hypothetical protein